MASTHALGVFSSLSHSFLILQLLGVCCLLRSEPGNGIDERRFDGAMDMVPNCQKVKNCSPGTSIQTTATRKGCQEVVTFELSFEEGTSSPASNTGEKHKSCSCR